LTAFLTKLDPHMVRLVISATANFKPTVATVRWRFDIEGFRGNICSIPGAPQSSFQVTKTSTRTKPVTETTTVEGTSAAANSTASNLTLPFLTIGLCWNQGAPISERGSYLSASIPRVLAAGLTGTITRGLTLPGDGLAGYSIQGGVPPTSVTGRNWVWTSDLSSSFDSQASSPIPIVSLNLSMLQNDNTRTFQSGILFGIAGSGLVTILPAIVGVFRVPRSGAGNTKNNDAKRVSTDEF
jgi:hypothetical protein